MKEYLDNKNTASAEDTANIAVQENGGEELEKDEPHELNVRLMSPAQMVIRRFFRSKLSVIGLIMIAFLFLFCFLGPVVYNRWGEIEVDDTPMVEYTSQELTYDLNGKTHTYHQIIEKVEKENALAPLSSEHPLGTDETGYDVLTRLMYGTRISLLVAFVAVLVNMIIGIIFGGISGYAGGLVDTVMMRIVDIISTIPLTLYVILIMVLLGNGMHSIIIALGTVYWVDMARVVRGQVLSLKAQEFVLAAKTIGSSTKTILMQHLIPNAMGPIIVSTAFLIPNAIFSEAFLSFLGIGIQAPKASWGSLANAAIPVMQMYPHLMFFPVIAICLTMFSFNFIGDGLRDALDPRLKK
jgi:oligopeptide transport system permease protein